MARSKSPSVPAPSHFPFLELPPELRTQILELALTQDEEIDVTWRDIDETPIPNPEIDGYKIAGYRELYHKLRPPLERVALFQVDKQLYREAFPVFMRRNTFVFDSPVEGEQWARFLLSRRGIPCPPIGKVVCRVNTDDHVTGPDLTWVPLLRMVRRRARCIRFEFDDVACDEDYLAYLRWGYDSPVPDKSCVKAIYVVKTPEGVKRLTFPQWLAGHFKRVEVVLPTYRSEDSGFESWRQVRQEFSW